MKRLRQEDDCSPPSSAAIGMTAAVPLLPICAFTAWTETMLPLSYLVLCAFTAWTETMLPLSYLVLSGQHIMQIKIILID
jgi:hypothetical protein